MILTEDHTKSKLSNNQSNQINKANHKKITKILILLSQVRNYAYL